MTTNAKLSREAGERTIAAPAALAPATLIALAGVGLAAVYMGAETCASGDEIAVRTEGTFEVACASGTTFSIGDDVEWDDDNDLAVVAGGDFRLGVAARAKVSGETTVLVDLNAPRAKLKVEAKTADYTVTAADRGKVFTNEGAAGAVVFSLPPATAGLGPYTFVVETAQALRIDPNGNETIGVETGVQGGAGKYVGSAIAGESLTIGCSDAGEWAILAAVGTNWTIEA
jgi:predicted RecA/RadA family phage recombinase